jgi:hypothetical protein
VQLLYRTLPTCVLARRPESKAAGSLPGELAWGHTGCDHRAFGHSSNTVLTITRHRPNLFGACATNQIHSVARACACTDSCVRVYEPPARRHDIPAPFCVAWVGRMLDRFMVLLSPPSSVCQRGSWASYQANTNAVLHVVHLERDDIRKRNASLRSHIRQRQKAPVTLSPTPQQLVTAPDCWRRCMTVTLRVESPAEHAK